MELHDVDGYLPPKSGGEAQEKVLIDKVHFQVVIDEAHPDVKPPLEELDGIVDRELLVLVPEARVLSQSRNTKTTVVDEIVSELGFEGDLASVTPPGDRAIEYGNVGSLPEGAFFFKGYSSMVHVDALGRVTQLDLVMPARDSTDPTEPLDREFKKILVKDVEHHDWSDIASLFLEPESPSSGESCD